MSSEQDDAPTVDLFDSLPYFDRDLELFPDLKRKVDAELAREAGKPSAALHPKVPPAATLFEARIRAHIKPLHELTWPVV